jgi:CRISPR-associated protein Cmr4
MEGALLFLYAETPVHPGAAESTGGIDLPVQREASTRLPVIWGETLKGALRASFRGADNGLVEHVFGSPPPGPGSDPPRPGAWAFGEARLLAFPVPTLRATFAWVTSPLLLERLTRLATLAGISGLPAIPRPAAEQVLAASDGWGERVAVADLDLSAVPGAAPEAAAWASRLAEFAFPEPQAHDPFAYFRDKLARDLLVVDDETLRQLTEECMEVTVRVQLDTNQKTVTQGPWYVECLPAETLLVSYQHRADPTPDPTADGGWPQLLDRRVVVLGGEETVGKGLLWCRVLGGG